LDAVRRYEILDTAREDVFDHITALAARLLRAPIALLSIVDHDRIWLKSCHGLDVEEIGRDPGLCASCIMQVGPWIVSNASYFPAQNSRAQLLQIRYEKLQERTDFRLGATAVRAASQYTMQECLEVFVDKFAELVSSIRMIHQQAIHARQKLLDRLPVTGEILRGSLLHRSVRPHGSKMRQVRQR
jgi:hypothetical protein